MLLVPDTDFMTFRWKYSGVESNLKELGILSPGPLGMLRMLEC